MLTVSKRDSVASLARKSMAASCLAVCFDTQDRKGRASERHCLTEGLLGRENWLQALGVSLRLLTASRVGWVARVAGRPGCWSDSVRVAKDQYIGNLQKPLRDLPWQGSSAVLLPLLVPFA